MEKNIYLILTIIGLLLAACDQNIDAFDRSTSFIHFDMPYIDDSQNSSVTERLDSLVYSFGLDGQEVTEYTFRIPVNAVTLPFNEPRDYKVTVVERESNIDANAWNKADLETAIVDAGAVKDTLEVTIQRSKVSAEEWNTLVLKVEENENFQVGDPELLKVRLVISSILLPPDWWYDGWDKYFGSFYREVYVKWQEIYYLGADPNVEKFGENVGKPLYWDNMPSSANSSSYPSTFMFIGKLKQYFEDNEIYPDGDRTKPRIKLPNV